MLQFWKRSGQREKTRSPTKSTTSSSSSTINDEVIDGNLLLSLEEEVFSSESDVCGSRLSKTLSEVLSDKSALGYFIQYLEIHGGLPLVRCWLDIESFKSAIDVSETVLNITRDQLEEARFVSPLPSTKHQDHDSLSVSTDCDSITADSNSLYDSLSEVRSPVDNCNKRFESDNSDISFKCKNDKKKVCQALVDDALKIFKKYVAPEASHSVHCVEDMRKECVEAICCQDGLDKYCYDKIQKHCYDLLEKNYFDGFLKSHFHCKYQIDVLTSGNIVLQDILYNESILFYFMEFLEQECGRNLLEFWMSANNFRDQLLNHSGSLNPQEAQNDAIILYDKYFSLQATCPLGFGDKIRFLVEENICCESGPKPDCFNQPLKIVEHVLEKYFLKTFLSSQLYFKYLSELISTVQTNGITQTHKRGASSDCSSEFSSYANNTLLASEDPVWLKPAKKNMTVDPQQLYDPDSLWKRRKSNSLSFGRINDLGRFETDVEPEPDKKGESKLARAVRRLINIEENKTKEEMAWKVAEMIIKDITSITLAENNS